MDAALSGTITIEAALVEIFHSAVARSSWISGCGDMFSNGNTSYAGSFTTDCGLHAPVNSQNDWTTGQTASAARLSATIRISGTPAARCKYGISRDFALEMRPDRRIRPTGGFCSPLRCFKYEAACWNPGLFSTSARTSLTTGR